MGKLGPSEWIQTRLGKKLVDKVRVRGAEAKNDYKQSSSSVLRGAPDFTHSPTNVYQVVKEPFNMKRKSLDTGTIRVKEQR